MTERELSNAMTAHGDTVYRLALCRLQNTADAEDVYQDVFLRLFSQSEKSWDSEHPKAGLIRATINRCADIGRFRLRRTVLSLEDIPEMARPVDERATELWEAVARLPEKLQVVVHLHYGEGYETREIGELLRIPPATVRTRLRRARIQLKQLLGGFEDDELPEIDTGYPYARRAE